MPKSLAPHLNFHGNAREVLTFYASALETEPAIRTYADFGMPAGLPGADKVVWGQVVSSDGVRIMAYDVPGPQTKSTGKQAGETRRESGLTIPDQSSFLALSCSTLAEATTVWDKLAVDATVVEPLRMPALPARPPASVEPT